MHLGIAAVRVADEAALARLLGRLERFDGAARREDPLDVLHLVHAVHLPEIDVIGLQFLERRLQIRLGPFARPLAGLGGEEDVLAKLGNHGAVDVFGAPFGVAARHVEVVDAEVVGAPHHGLALFKREPGESGRRLRR